MTISVSATIPPPTGEELHDARAASRSWKRGVRIVVLVLAVVLLMGDGLATLVSYRYVLQRHGTATATIDQVQSHTSPGRYGTLYFERLRLHYPNHGKVSHAQLDESDAGPNQHTYTKGERLKIHYLRSNSARVRLADATHSWRTFLGAGILGALAAAWSIVGVARTRQTIRVDDEIFASRPVRVRVRYSSQARPTAPVLTARVTVLDPDDNKHVLGRARVFRSAQPMLFVEQSTERTFPGTGAFRDDVLVGFAYDANGARICQVPT